MFWRLSVFLPEVTKILLFAAQASHQLVPPEVSVHLCAMFNGQQASMGMLCVGGRGKGNWSDCLEKLMVISAIFCKFQGIVS